MEEKVAVAAEEFEGAIDEAKRLEKKTVEYAPYQGDITVEKTIDFEPKEYVDLSYHDMINLYERNEKIISTVSMGLLAAKAEGAPEAPQSAESGEIESKLRQMTSETLKEAEEVGKEPIVMEKEAAPAPEEGGIKLEGEAEAPKAPAIEFETRPAAEAPKPEIAKPSPAEAPRPEEAELEMKPAEAPSEPRIEAPPAGEKKVIVAAVVPPALRESPDQAAAQRYERMEEQVRSTLGEKADEATIKKKMLELTKQLFKEKTTSKREEIKLQIATLKNMLSGAEAGGPRAAAAAPAKGAKKKDETHQKMYDAMLSTHQTELSQTKDSIIDSYNKQIGQVKKKFYEDIGSTEDAAKRKDIFEGFVFSIESLVHQLPEVIGKYKEFTVKKHGAEMEKLRDSLEPDEKDLRSTVEGRLEYINGKYDTEFASVKGIIGREMDNLIEVAGADIFKKPEGAAAPEEEGGKPVETEARAYEVVREINETDEGTLLYFLHSKDPEYYKRYERKSLSKAEAIFKAKELMAKDKGLSDAMVKRYFTQMEG